MSKLAIAPPTVWPQGIKMGSSVIIFLPLPNEIEYSDSFLQKMRLPSVHLFEDQKVDYETVGILENSSRDSDLPQLDSSLNDGPSVKEKKKRPNKNYVGEE